jgi:transcriptional regulator with XRE-family HTH domain
MATDKEKLKDAAQTAFGQVLRQAREGRGLSQQDLAFESDLDRTYISLLERGLRQPTLATLFLLASALGTDAADLVRKTAAHPNYAKAKR